jgi:thioredoxin 1
MAGLKKIEESDFDAAVLESGEPVAVLFKSEWCPGCKLMTPIAEELATEGVNIVYVDVTESQALAGRYDVMSIPAAIIFSGGEEKKRFVGPVSGDDIKEALK